MQNSVLQELERTGPRLNLQSQGPQPVLEPRKATETHPGLPQHEQSAETGTPEAHLRHMQAHSIRLKACPIFLPVGPFVLRFRQLGYHRRLRAKGKAKTIIHNRERKRLPSGMITEPISLRSGCRAGQPRPLTAVFTFMQSAVALPMASANRDGQESFSSATSTASRILQVG